MWVRLDDGFTRHPRMIAAGLHGRGLFIAGLCYCGTHLTDGMIPKAAFQMLCAEAGVPAKTWQRLIDVGSWVDKGDHIEVHDFLVYNPSRAKVLGDREAGAARQRKARESRSTSRVTDEATDGVSPRDPSRPVPIPNSSSNGFNTELPPGLWMKVAEEKLKLQRPGSVNDPDRWLPATARDAENNLTAKAHSWNDEFDLSTQQLACALATGVTSPTWNCYRRKPA